MEYSHMSSFSERSLKFLIELKENNCPEWFNKREDDYETYIREPALSFIIKAQPLLYRMSRHFDAIPKKQGGSLMKVHRDTQFANDKPPYKTNIGIQFRHVLGKDVHSPSFYIHIEPKRSFISAGIWQPESKTLLAIRESIRSNPEKWQSIKNDRRISDCFQWEGEQLKRPPRGFESNERFIDDLKRKDFILVQPITHYDVCHLEFSEIVFREFSKCGKFMTFLCHTLGMPY